MVVLLFCFFFRAARLGRVAVSFLISYRRGSSDLNFHSLCDKRTMTIWPGQTNKARMKEATEKNLLAHLGETVRDERKDVQTGSGGLAWQVFFQTWWGRGIDLNDGETAHTCTQGKQICLKVWTERSTIITLDLVIYVTSSSICKYQSEKEEKEMREKVNHFWTSRERERRTTNKTGKKKVKDIVSVKPCPIIVRFPFD